VIETRDPAGAAALSICESLLLCMTDLRLLTEPQVVAILEDAAAAHRTHALETSPAPRSAAAADLIEAILAGGNSVRRR
jgi:hypothetical protein